MAIQVFTPDQLSNEDYRQLPQMSGSGLHTIYSDNPAQWRFGEPDTDRKVLDFGIYSHAMILEPARFAEHYAKDFDSSVYESILVTASDMQSWLKERGAKVSGAKAELIERILATGEPVHIAEVEGKAYRESLPGREFIGANDYAKLEKMRAAIMADEEIAKMLEGGFAEYSIVGDEWKVRPDLITSGASLINYKTSTSAHHRDYGKKAHDYGYLLKAALEWEMFKKAYGHEPRSYVLLVQQKHSPFIFKPWRLDKRLMGIGRAQLNEAIRVFRQCRDNNVWPALGGLEDLTLPEFILNQYPEH